MGLSRRQTSRRTRRSRRRRHPRLTPPLRRPRRRLLRLRPRHRTAGHCPGQPALRSPRYSAAMRARRGTPVAWQPIARRRNARRPAGPCAGPAPATIVGRGRVRYGRAVVVMTRLWGRSHSSEGAGAPSAVERVGTEDEAVPGASAIPAAGVHDDAIHDDAIHDDAIHDDAIHGGGIHDDAIRDEATRDEATRGDAVHGDHAQDVIDSDPTRGDGVETDVLGVFGETPTATGNQLDWPTLNWSAVN